MLASGNTIIMDASHNAAGESNTGKNLQSIVGVSKGVTKGVTFLSVAFAKRTDNISIYALKMAINETNLGNEGLTEAIKKKV